MEGYPSNTYGLYIDSDKVDVASALAIRVTFHASPEGGTLDPKLVTVTTTVAENRRWDLLEEHNFREATQPTYGQVIFRVQKKQLQRTGKPDQFY